MLTKQENNLDAKELLTSGPYKEIYRSQMIVWGEEKRNQDPGYFCRLAAATAVGEGGRTWPVWIVADARRPSDVEYFQVNVLTTYLLFKLLNIL